MVSRADSRFNLSDPRFKKERQEEKKQITDDNEEEIEEHDDVADDGADEVVSDAEPDARDAPDAEEEESQNGNKTLNKNSFVLYIYYILLCHSHSEFCIR